MNRTQLSKIINDAHDALHDGDTDKAHEILHTGYQVEPYQSSTGDPEAQSAAQELMKAAAKVIPCGHAAGDLVVGGDGITKCAACILERTGLKPRDTFDTGLSKAQLERLAILSEECSEVIKIVGKIIRHGYQSHNPQKPELGNNRIMLERELGDVEYAIGLLEKSHDVNPIEIKRHGNSKAQRAQQYLHFQPAKS